MKDLSLTRHDSQVSPGPTAAVAIIRCPDPAESILLLRRAQNRSDPWSGHFAFPGGRWETYDQTLYNTCVREVLEETGIELPDQALEHVLTPSLAGRNVKAPVLVQPYLFELASRPPVIVESAEIDNFQWLETGAFRDKTQHIRTEALPGRFRPAFPLGDYYVWGFTYLLLCAVLDVEPDW